MEHEGTLHLRQATVDDVLRIASLHVASWRDAYGSILDPAFLAGPIEGDRLNVWRGRLTSPPKDQRIIVALEGRTLVGFVCTLAVNDPSWGALIDNLHVAPSARRRGAGAVLLQSAASWVEAAYPGSGLHLYVFEANEPARKFYERFGAKTVGKLASEIPSASGAPVLRLHWPKASGVCTEAGC